MYGDPRGRGTRDESLEEFAGEAIDPCARNTSADRKKKTTRLPLTRWHSQNCSFTELKKALRRVVNYVFILA